MRHNNKINALGRKSAHRKAMLSNMAASLILHKRIKTTVAKAKALRVFIEPIITKSKEDTTHSRRLAFGYLQDKKAVAELFKEVSPKVHERPGGYTRILKLGQRMGDAAEVCFIELVDFNETMLTAKAATEAKVTRRGRRASRKKTEVGTAVKAGATTVSDDKSPDIKEEETSTAAVVDNESDVVAEIETATDTEIEDTSATAGQSGEPDNDITDDDDASATEPAHEEPEEKEENKETKGEKETGGEKETEETKETKETKETGEEKETGQKE